MIRGADEPQQRAGSGVLNLPVEPVDNFWRRSIRCASRREPVPNLWSRLRIVLPCSLSTRPISRRGHLDPDAQ
jgi:hypothetical protein